MSIIYIWISFSSRGHRTVPFPHDVLKNSCILYCIHTVDLVTINWSRVNEAKLKNYCGVNCRLWQGFSLRRHVQHSSAYQPVPFPMCTGSFFPEVRRLECEVDHPPSIAEVRNAWSCITALRIHLRGVVVRTGLTLPLSVPDKLGFRAHIRDSLIPH